MNFKEPDFSKKDIELRYEENIVCIYGTATGLRQIAELCIRLAQNPKQGHIHLDTAQLLTKNSQIGTVAIFDKPN